jgi:hypothetical protein
MKRIECRQQRMFLTNLKAETMYVSISLLHACSGHHIHLGVCMDKRFIIPYYLSVILLLNGTSDYLHSHSKTRMGRLTPFFVFQ